MAAADHPAPDRAVPRDAVVFDCDGLLFNTQGTWDRAYAALFTRYGAELHPAQRHALVGLQLVPLGHALADLLGHPAPPHVLGREIYHLVQTNLDDGYAPMPGAVELVTALAGTRPLAVASNTPAPIVRSYLAAFDLLAAFDTVLGTDDAPRPKPAPDLYRLACHRLGVPPSNAVALEDSPTGVTAARAAGMHVIGVPSAPDLHLDAHHIVPTLNDPRLWRHLAATPLKPARPSAPALRRAGHAARGPAMGGRRAAGVSPAV